MTCRAARAIMLAIAVAGWSAGRTRGQAPLPGRFAGDGIVVGFEYALLDNERLAAGMAEAFARIGLPGMKHYVEAVQWGNMQGGPDEEIDFTKFDRFVREYQTRGFTELTISLKPHSVWASRDVRLLTSTNASPKPEYVDLFREWVRAVVERYDGDGAEDMDGLRWPIRYVEIGNELSSYQPEPVDEYLETLTHAYEAAHAASEDVLIGHAAFLFAPVNMDVTDLSQVDSVWAGTRRVDDHHDLADMRAILDRPDAFDFINIHNLGPPYEIEHVMRWLRHETASRGYEKPVVISDTTPTSYIGWGPATECTGPVLGVLGAPATEADRCRLAGFFTRLVQNDRATLDWTRGFVAADHVQRLIIAAEQGVRIINLAFVTDLPWLTLEPMRAGAGISAWGGAIRINPWTGRVLDYHPPFYAVRQMMDHLAGYAAIEHLRTEDERIRVYRVDGAAGPFWVAWLDPERAIIAGDDPPMIEVAIDIGAAGADIEPVITAVGQTDPTRTRVRAPGGSATVTLSHAPIYIFPTPPG